MELPAITTSSNAVSRTRCRTRFFGCTSANGRSFVQRLTPAAPRSYDRGAGDSDRAVASDLAGISRRAHPRMSRARGGRAGSGSDSRQASPACTGGRCRGRHRMPTSCTLRGSERWASLRALRPRGGYRQSIEFVALEIVNAREGQSALGSPCEANWLVAADAVA